MDLPDRKISFEKWWPNLRRTGYIVTSAQDRIYNCFAWAAGDTTACWDPLPEEGKDSYWPEGVPRVNTIEAFVQAYETIGFSVCDSPDLEAGIEKIVIYANNGVPDHAARQLPNGRWTSKIGEYEDVEHDIGAFKGGKYFGEVAVILKRSVNF